MYTSYRPLKIVIVGGVAAGLSAAMRARRNNPQSEITVIQKEEHISYAACGLPYFIGGQIPAVEDLIVRQKDEIEAQNIRVLSAHEALSFNGIKKRVVVKELNRQKTFELSYDRLIIASGARPRRLDIPGVGLDGIFYLRSLNDGMAIDAYIREQHPRKALILGSGFIGLEMAEALSLRGLEITLVESAAQVLPVVHPAIAEKLMAGLLARGCRFMINNSVLQFNGEKRLKQVVFKNGGSEDFDLVLIAAGVEPNTSFAQSGGVRLGAGGAIAVNDKMETNLQGVYAAGDCCQVRHRVSNRYTWIPLGTTANKQGRVAGDNASGRYARFKGVTGTMAVKVFDMQIALSGLTGKDLEKVPGGWEQVVVKQGSRAHYYPGGAEISVVMTWARRDGRLLAVQMIGEEGVAKRIDVAALALQQKMTVRELAEADLSYAPPFAPVNDPLMIAARRAVKMLEKSDSRPRLG